jgi:hypothetical protein
LRDFGQASLIGLRVDTDDATARSCVGEQHPDLQQVEEAGEDDVEGADDARWISRQRVEEQRSEAGVACSVWAKTTPVVPRADPAAIE